jgi:UDP-GlcNAc:undecaprenyl-phosphate GlcNAc-1-phosphate transferase
MISSTIVQVGLPLLVTVLFMLALRPAARGLQLIDRPGGRKMHVGDIPVIGGLAMTGGVMVAGAYGGAGTGHASPFFLSAVILLVLIGALDDRYDLPPSVRFLAQICASLLMIAGAGVFVQDLGTFLFDDVVELGWFSIPFTVLIVLTAVNAFNMFDGSDGVAGAQALVSLVFIGFACFMSGQVQYVGIVAGLVGCVLGFLFFNWPSRRTANLRSFMGDAGSTMLGFSLAWISVEISQAPARVITPVVVLWIFALPIFDLFSSMVRRMSRGQSPFHGDSEHLHHVLKRRWGLSSRRVAQGVLLGAAILAGIGVGGHFAGVSDGWLFVTWAAAGVVYHGFFGGSRVHASDDPQVIKGESTSPR